MATTTPKRVAIYARVSTKAKDEDPKAKKKKAKQQDPENQLAQLREWCQRSGHEIVAEYVERESGRKGAAERAELSRLFSDASKRRFDLVLFWSLDRFSREGMTKTVSYLQRLDAAGVAFHSFTEEMLSTDNELVRDILIAVMASLAKQEAIKISQRTKAGLERAKAEGKTLGRPKVDPAVSALVKHTREAFPEMSERKLAKYLGVPRSTVQKILSG